MTNSNTQYAAEPKLELEFTTGLWGRLAGVASRIYELELAVCKLGSFKMVSVGHARQLACTD
jgi:hypothetical protein